MRHLLSGIAVAALLATGLPAVANDDAGSGATMAPDTAAPTVKAKPKHFERRGKTMTQQRHTRSPDDSMAEQLNRQELRQLGQGPADAATSTGSSVPPRR